MQPKENVTQPSPKQTETVKTRASPKTSPGPAPPKSTNASPNVSTRTVDKHSPINDAIMLQSLRSGATGVHSRPPPHVVSQSPQRMYDFLSASQTRHPTLPSGRGNPVQKLQNSRLKPNSKRMQNALTTLKQEVTSSTSHFSTNEKKGPSDFLQLPNNEQIANMGTSQTAELWQNSMRVSFSSFVSISLVFA